MLKVQVDDERVRGLEFGGDPETLALEVCGLMEAIHYAISRVNPYAAAEFRLTVQLLVEDDESPVWAGKGRFNGEPLMVTLNVKGGKGHGNDV